MTSSDSNDQTDRPETETESAQPPEIEAKDTPQTTPPKRRILIGSQRDPAAYRPKPKRDWTPLEEKPAQNAPAETATPDEPPAVPSAAQDPPPAQASAPQETTSAEETKSGEEPAGGDPPIPVPEPAADADADAKMLDALDDAVPLFADEVEPLAGDGPKKYPLPNIRAELPPDLEEEFQEALADVPVVELMTDREEVTKQPLLDTETKYTGRVVAVRRDDVFVELGGREQGMLPITMFQEPPQVDATVEVRVVRFNPEDGLYELTLPGSAANVGDWDDLEEGMIVDARITGHNTGGLECEVSRIRGFIPVSQIALYRVEDLTEFVDQKLTCLVTEVNPRRGNLVLSHRAVLEREREEAKRQLLESLAPGQVHEGVVRKLMDFGAFVDIGGVDGLLHVSQLSWARVSHPRDVLHEGQSIKVRIDKYDAETGRISLSYRDMLENPWTDAEKKYPPSMQVKGKVTKLMEFGAFVELEPGVEGLVHISELSHKRVWKASDVVNEGDEVEVLVLSTDPTAQRISLSIKDLTAEPEPEVDETASDDKDPPPKKLPAKPSQPLKGGLGRSPHGEQFGLKW